MSEDSLTDGLRKARPVLGDLTNRPIKRGFSSLLGDSKSADGSAKSFEGGSEDSQSMKRFIRGKNVAEPGIECSETETDSSQENTESLVSNREFKSSVLDDASRDSSFSSVPIETWSELWNNDACPGRDEDRRRASDASVTQSKLVERPSWVAVCKESEEGIGVGSVFSAKSGSIEWSRLTKQGQQPRGFERCTTLAGGDDILKACSCAFCLKAAYIWSDLQYQDIKGRLSALKKSKKEATALAQRNCKGKRTDLCGQGNPMKPSKLESDLNDQWKSLFVYMEDVLVNESNQLQAGFLALKDLRENCKTDLKMINGTPSEKH